MDRGHKIHDIEGNMIRDTQYLYIVYNTDRLYIKKLSIHITNRCYNQLSLFLITFVCLYNLSFVSCIFNFLWDLLCEFPFFFTLFIFIYCFEMSHDILIGNEIINTPFALCFEFWSNF